MGLWIGDQFYSQKMLDQNPNLLGEALGSLCGLPETPVSPISIGAESVSNRIIIKEKEMLLKDASDPQSLIGTVDQWTCCTLYLRDDEGDHGLIHVSPVANHLDPFISLFEGKQQVKAILVGGLCSREADKKLSINNILKVLKALICSPQAFTVESQKVLMANKTTEHGFRESVKRLLLEKARIYYKKILHKPMPEAMLCRFDANDFLQRAGSNDIESENVLESVMYKLISVDSLMEPCFVDYINKIRNKPSAMVHAEQKILRMLDLMFTREGFLMLEKNKCLEGIKKYPELINFVFDTKTHVIHKINDKYEDGIRQLYLYDPSRGSQYFMAFYRGMYRAPVLSHQFRDDIVDLYDEVNKELLSENVIKKIREVTDLSMDMNHIQIFSELVLDYAPVFSDLKYKTCTQLWQMPRICPSINHAEPNIAGKMGVF